ncbi:MAG: SMC-Scp complex subunit ScpB [Gammaproteobacteria bacterium]|nr:SMC-Scp complex subunit ScpB [Gammaproteobacteria bacterium]
MDQKRIRNIVEAGLLAVGGPLSIDQLQGLFGTDLDSIPEKQDIRDAVATLTEEYADKGIQLVEVASGFRIQVRKELSEWISRLWLERPPRYSRALLETLSIIAYRQPVTRGEIEDVRGVAVSSNIVRTLLDRGWIRVLGHRDVPGKPAIFGTTREFLDYFGLKNLSDLPTLADISDLDNLNVELDLPDPEFQEFDSTRDEELPGERVASKESDSTGMENGRETATLENVAVEDSILIAGTSDQYIVMEQEVSDSGSEADISETEDIQVPGEAWDEFPGTGKV